MEIYFAGQPVIITVPLVTSGGVAVTDATSASYRVLDGQGAEVIPVTDIEADLATGLVEVTIAGEQNVLAAGEGIRGFRQIEVRFVNASGVFTVFDEFLIEAADSLVPLSNSFQSYAQAMVLAAEVTGIDSLLGSTRRERIAALVNAHNTISRLRYQVSDGYMAGRNQSRLDWHYIKYVDLASITAADYAKLPAPFLRAVCMAQLIEANEALDQFSIHRKRQQGLMSETIGESSMMFRPEKVLNIPVTRRSLDLLRPYLVWELSIGRG